MSLKLSENQRFSFYFRGNRSWRIHLTSVNTRNIIGNDPQTSQYLWSSFWFWKQLWPSFWPISWLQLYRNQLIGFQCKSIDWVTLLAWSGSGIWIDEKNLPNHKPISNPDFLEKLTNNNTNTRFRIWPLTSGVHKKVIHS